MRRTLSATAALLLLGGCGFTSQGTAIKNAVQTYGAQAYDAGLENAEWFICNAASVGSIRRRYGQSADSADTYRKFCETGNVGGIIAPPPAGVSPNIGPPQELLP